MLALPGPCPEEGGLVGAGSKEAHNIVQYTGHTNIWLGARTTQDTESGTDFDTIFLVFLSHTIFIDN